MSKNRSSKPKNSPDPTAGSIESSNPSNDEITRSVDDNANTIIASQIKQEFSGPIPPPITLKQYDEVVPGAADRIIRMAEQEQKNRYEVIDKVILNRRLRILGGVVASLALVVGAVIASYFGQSAVAIVLGGVGVVGALTQEFLRRFFPKKEEP